MTLLMPVQSPASPMTLDPILAFLGSAAIWPIALIVLVPVALVLVPRDQRVVGLHALAELVRAARGRGDPGSTVRLPDEASPPKGRGTARDDGLPSRRVSDGADRRVIRR